MLFNSDKPRKDLEFSVRIACPAETATFGSLGTYAGSMYGIAAVVHLNAGESSSGQETMNGGTVVTATRTYYVQ